MGKPKGFLSISTVAGLLGFSERWVWDRIYDGTFDTKDMRKPGGNKAVWRITRDSYDAFVNGAKLHYSTEAKRIAEKLYENIGTRGFR